MIADGFGVLGAAGGSRFRYAKNQIEAVSRPGDPEFIAEAC